MSEFFALHELSILRYFHILAMVFWLGGEWGVFQTSYKVVNSELTAPERLRHLDTVFRIDVLARIGIVSLLPLGLHMGYLWGLQPYGGVILTVVWILWAILVAITLFAFRDKMAKNKSIFGHLEDWSRYVQDSSINRNRRHLPRNEFSALLERLFRRQFQPAAAG